MQEAQQIAEDAYIYGYALVAMEMTRRVMTNVREPDGKRAPMGYLLLYRTYPTAEFKDVTAPNADTLYATAWIDVGKEPWVLSLPDANDRYCLFPMLDGWTDFFQVPGKRTTGTGPQTYAITGPGLKGELPPVDGFWSLTMYNADYFFVDNPLNRYTLSARDDLNLNADGSVDLYLQQANPGP